MTIRVPRQIRPLDQERLASVVTMAVLHPAVDGKPSSAKPGLAWVHWSETQALPGSVPHLD